MWTNNRLLGQMPKWAFVGRSKLQPESPMRLDQLEAEFQRLGIDYREPGFYDTPAFLAVERMDPRFLSYYAEYVDRRTYTAEYMDRVRELVPRLARLFSNGSGVMGA